MSAEAVTLMAFVTGGQHFVLDVMRVRELVRAMPLVPSPGAPPWLLGHMVLRGEVLPVLSLKRALTQGLQGQGQGQGFRATQTAEDSAQADSDRDAAGQSATPLARRATQIMVLDVAGHSLGLMVDRVSEVVRLPHEALRPDLGPEALRSPVSFGICDVRGVAHLLLDVRPLLALCGGNAAH